MHETDRDYAYDSVHELDISAIAPQITVPHAPDDVKPVAAVAGTRIDQVYLGSCASGRVEDLEIAARIMKGRQVHPDVRFIVTPGSREVLKEATKLGYISVQQLRGHPDPSASFSLRKSWEHQPRREAAKIAEMIQYFFSLRLCAFASRS